jgi:hypothetical protein
MKQWAPCKRREFVRRLRELGFDGPLSGARHEFIVNGHCLTDVAPGVEFSTPARGNATAGGFRRSSHRRDLRPATGAIDRAPTTGQTPTGGDAAAGEFCRSRL